MSNEANLPIWRRQEPILGVCEALGDDFGISAHWFRAVLAPLVLWNPLVAVGGYAAAGVLVLGSRLLFPDVREAVSAGLIACDTLIDSNEEKTEELALAA